MLNLILLVIILCFTAWELCVHFFVNQRIWKTFEPHTLSSIIWQLERRFGWPVRLTVGLAIAILFVHLEIHWP